MKPLTCTRYNLTVSATSNGVTFHRSESLIDQLTMKTAQLEALLEATCGESGEGFRGMADEMQDSFMWAASSLAHEVRLLAALVAREKTTGRKPDGSSVSA